MSKDSDRCILLRLLGHPTVRLLAIIEAERRAWSILAAENSLTERTKSCDAAKPTAIAWRAMRRLMLEHFARDSGDRLHRITALSLSSIIAPSMGNLC